MKSVLLTYYFISILLVVSVCTYAEPVSWSGFVALKNNYVFSTGTEVDDKPVVQYGLTASWENGFYADLWSSLPTTKDNPNRSARN